MHAVVHNWKAGGHAVSADRGKTWQWFGGNCSSAAGPGSVDWTRSVWPATFTYNGSTQGVSPHRRERPHIVVDGRGQIVALTNGIQTVRADVTWTMVNPVVQAAE